MLTMTMHFINIPAPAIMDKIKTITPGAMPVSVNTVLDDCADSFKHILQMSRKQTREHLKPMLNDLPVGQVMRERLLEGNVRHGWPVIFFAPRGQIVLSLAWYGPLVTLQGPQLGDASTN